MDNQLDPTVVNLAKAIRQSETGGDYNAVGDVNASHKSFGAYQFGEDTWNATAPKYGINVPIQKATPEQQNAVAYNQIKEWKDSGKDVTQVASMWNAGEGEPDAYTGKFSNGQSSVKPGKFDVPAYVKSVAQAYQILKAGGQVQADPNNPSSTAAPQPQAEQSPSVVGFLGNVLKSGANFVGGVASAVAHPIDTVGNIMKLGAGAIESGVGSLTGKPIQNEDTGMWNKVVNFYGKRYGGSSIEEVAKNILHSAYTDPVGVAADASVLLSAGAAIAGKVGAISDLNEAMRIADAGGTMSEVSAAQGASTASKISSGLNTASEAVNPVVQGGKVISGGVGLLRKVGTAPLGLTTGVGLDPITQGLRATSAGGDARQAFVEGLRGNAPPEQLVTDAKNALDQVISQRGQTYQEMLSSLGKDKTTYDISPIIKEADNQLSKFGVSQTADGLDFSRSKFALDTTAQKDITNLYDYVKAYGSKAGDRTALGVDNLKQVLGGYYSPNSDYRAFTQGIKDSARTVLNDAPGYTKAMQNYSDFTDTINETKKALSLGDKATTETAFKKLTSSLKNNDVRQQIITELDQATGGNLLAKVAGQRLSSLMPRGLAGYTEAGIGGVAAATGGGLLPLLGMVITSSPRLVGEFINALGIGSIGAAKVMNMLNKMRTPLTGGGIMSRLINQNSTQPTIQ